MSEAAEKGAVKGDGYAVANLSDLGEGYGFRKIRKGLGVTAFGANAIVIPPSYETGRHLHEEQEELYFLHSGNVAIEFGDGTAHELKLSWRSGRGRSTRNLDRSRGVGRPALDEARREGDRGRPR